jgi:nucleotide-binding universal stress UspA family protein
MPFQSLLVPVDLSPLTDRVLGRVALLPLAPKARITLAHTVPSSLAMGAQRRASREAKDTLLHEREQLLTKLPSGVSVRVVVNVGASDEQIAAAAGVVEADLVVMGRGSPRGLRDAFLGSTAERVIRKARVPILAVRTAARTAYRRPLAALDVDAGASDVVTLLLRLLAPPRPSVTVVHAYDMPLREMRYRNLADDDFAELRGQYRQSALTEIAGMLRKTLPAEEAARWQVQAKLGSPRAVLLKAVKQEHPDLLALATHGYSGAAHAFLGTVAGDMLRHVACDTLVVPPIEGRAGHA